MIREYIARVDGLLFTGGVDVAPWRFGEEPIRQLGRIGFERDECEMRLLEAALERGMPVFGICRGHQLVNIALGGSVFQDIHAQRPGSGGHYPEDFPVDELYHHIDVTSPHSVIAAALGAGKSLVNSFHHQAIDRLAPGLAVTAVSEDGIIEACERAGSYLVTVQFHPESLTLRYPRFLALFGSFVAAAGHFSEAGRNSD
jgi:putative glutamine amidotransferase